MTTNLKLPISLFCEAADALRMNGTASVLQRLGGFHSNYVLIIKHGLWFLERFKNYDFEYYMLHAQYLLPIWGYGNLGWDKLQHYIYKSKQGDIFVIFVQRKAALFERDDVFSGALFWVAVQ